MADMVHVQLCYAAPMREYFRELAVAPGTTIEQAIMQSGVLQDIPGIDLTVQPVGIFGKKRSLDTVLRERDRVEIYRPLIADPKDSRRRRSEKRAAAA